MMAKTLCISILFLITQLKAQEGLGCAEKTCPTPGQVRMNAVFNPQGEYLSGCNCVTGIVQLPQIPITVPPITIPPITVPSIPQPNLPAPPQSTQPQPQVSQPQPQPQPQASLGTPLTVICDGTGQSETLCACPVGHIGSCKLICEGTPDACKDVQIECNNDGYPCIVDCIASNACSSNTIINGPKRNSLTVNCLGKKSCEGDTIFNNEQGTDLTVVCNGMTSCKDAIFHFGNGMGLIECIGLPDGCKNAQINLLPTMHGFECIGSQCPQNAPQSFIQKPTTGLPTMNPIATPSASPITKRPSSNPTKRPSSNPTTKRPSSNPTLQPTKRPSSNPTKMPSSNPTTKMPSNNPTLQPTKRPSSPPTGSPTTSIPTKNPTTSIPTKNPTPYPTVDPTKCTTSGNCECTPGANSPCKIECDVASNACKDGLIRCNSDGYDCIVDCLSPESCSGDSIIVGPIGASLTVNCIGSKSCQGAVSIEGFDGIDLTVDCVGNEACKGSGVVFNFGSGIGQVFCSGNPDSCIDATFNIDPTTAKAFQCIGNHCPINPASFNNGIQPLPNSPQNIVNVNAPPTGPPIDPILNNIRQPIQIQPGQIISNISPYCCRTRLLNFNPWKGLCWGKSNAIGCNLVDNGRCVWDPTDCIADPPVNSFGKICKFNADICLDDSDCCSETCVPGTKTCR